jgi:phage pi2 protein 07
MNDRTITITLDEYRELVQKSERIATLQRLFAKSDYVAAGDIKNVLGIEEKATAKADEVKNGVL